MDYIRYMDKSVSLYRLDREERVSEGEVKELLRELEGKEESEGKQQ